MNNKKIFTISIILILLILIISLVFLFKNNKLAEDESINVYYLDNTSNTLVYEKKQLLQNNELELEEILDSMKEQPKTLSNATSVVPEDLTILSYEYLENNTLKVNFSSEYKNMDETEEILFRSAFVWTVTELDNIENVNIYVEDEPIQKGDGTDMGDLNRENVVLNPTISPENTEEREVILYFADEEELELVKEVRTIEFKQSQSIETNIVEQLIQGPEEEGHYRTIPEETKIRNIKTEGGICYVDLSSEFVTKNTGGSSAEYFAIYSIVNSLTELEEVNKVQFLIEGEKVGVYKSSLDISKPIGRLEDE